MGTQSREGDPQGSLCVPKPIATPSAARLTWGSAPGGQYECVVPSLSLCRSLRGSAGREGRGCPMLQRHRAPSPCSELQGLPTRWWMPFKSSHSPRPWLALGRDSAGMSQRGAGCWAPCSRCSSLENFFPQTLHLALNSEQCKPH